ncbi:MAG: glycosyltransferase [Candidatus Aenigmarchaeota archaeon]|nr:glycosyltransferase [Candidatus Aenigmarchaeota archaeon]
MFSLIIPAYNEEDGIRKILTNYSKYFKKHLTNYEIIVVCDGADKTVDIVRDIKRGNRKIRLLVFNKRLGKGGAVYAGFNAAKGSIIGFTDADLSVSPEDYFKLIKTINGHDCAIASRRAIGSKISTNRPLSIRVASVVFNKLVNLMFNLGVKDTQCGAKVLKKETYNKIKNKLKLTFFEFDVELLWRLKRNGYKIKEIPIVWSHGKQSKTYLRNSPRLLFSLLKLRFQER